MKLFIDFIQVYTKITTTVFITNDKKPYGILGISNYYNYRVSQIDTFH
jgi:hypothetical protein